MFTQDIIFKIIQTYQSLIILKEINKNSTNIPMIDDVSELITQIEVTGCLTNNQILHIFQNKFNLQDHFKIIKYFYLFGQGDIYYNIIEAIEKKNPEIDINNFFQENISSRCSTSFNESYLKNLSLVYYSELSVYNLKYTFDKALSIFFTENIQSNLQEIFRFIFQLKSLEYNIKSISCDKILKISYETDDNLDCSHKYFILKYQIVSLLNIIIYFYMIEIIEKEWNLFIAFSDSSITIKDLLINFNKTIASICYFCKENSPVYKALNDFFDILKDFIKLRNEMIIHGFRVYKNSQKKIFLNNIQTISDGIKDIISRLKSNLSMIPFDYAHLLRLRLYELN